ncbi:hypothetical protein B484DRAFT_463261 [Ochromonadaceae sp. CCMP2298]|nr:hypothetical protein B484DRAFT_463261 [Ochromonadaceae sp. CCMP2298]
MADQLTLAPSVEFYYGRLDQHIRQIDERERKIAVHDEKIDDCMSVIKSALSSAVCVTAEDLLSSRDLYSIWQGLQRLCGPRSSNTGLSALERMDKMARSFNAYGHTFAKSEQHCAILVREALKTSKHWEKLEAEIHEAERLGLDWEELKICLVRRASTLDADATSGKGHKGDSEKALAAQPAVKALIDKAREQGRTQASGGKGDSKGDRREPGPTTRQPRTPRGENRGAKGPSDAINITCFGCGQYGHPLVDCPYSKKLAAFQKTLPTLAITDKPKAKPTPVNSQKTTAAAALAALTEGGENDQGDGDAQEEEVSGAAMCTEPMDDWLTSEHSCVAYTPHEPTDESPAPPPDSESESEDWLPMAAHRGDSDSNDGSDAEPYSSTAANLSGHPLTYGVGTGPQGERTMLVPPPYCLSAHGTRGVAPPVPGQQGVLGGRGTAGWESEAAGAAHVPSQSSQLVVLSDGGTTGWESEAAGAAHVPSQSSPLVVLSDGGTTGWESEAAGAAHVSSQSSQPVAPGPDDHESDCLCDDCNKVPPLVDVKPARHADDFNPYHDSGNTIHVPVSGLFDSEGGYEFSQLHVDAVGPIAAREEEHTIECNCNKCKRRFADTSDMPDLVDKESDDDDPSGNENPEGGKELGREHEVQRYVNNTVITVESHQLPPQDRDHSDAHHQISGALDHFSIAAPLGQQGLNPFRGTIASGESELDSETRYADDFGEVITCPTMESCLVSKSGGRKTTLIDTGCSAHVNAGKVNRLTNFKEKTELISLGDTSMKSASQGRGDLGPLRNVMYAPGMSFNLISVSAMDKLGYVTVCAGGECCIVNPYAAESIVRAVSALEHGAVTIRAVMGPDRLYHVRDAEQLESALTASPAAVPTPYTFTANRAEIKGSKGTLRDGSTAGLNALQLLHLRTAHLFKRTILAGLKANAFRGAQITYAQCKDLEIGPCEGCMLGNMRADSIPVSRRTYSNHAPMQEVGIDPVPLSTTTIDGGSVANMGIDYVTKLMFCYEARTDGQ